jgi:hypothetical protein
MHYRNSASYLQNVKICICVAILWIGLHTNTHCHMLCHAFYAKWGSSAFSGNYSSDPDMLPSISFKTIYCLKWCIYFIWFYWWIVLHNAVLQGCPYGKYIHYMINECVAVLTKDRPGQVFRIGASDMRFEQTISLRPVFKLDKATTNRSIA